jgi:FkbM family methyltransferase
MKKQIRLVLERLGYRIEGIRYTPRPFLRPERLRRLQFDDVVCRRIFEHGGDFVFVQVGAFDGLAADPLRKYIQRCGWRGVMLEPQPGPAARLRALYAQKPEIVVLNAAVDRTAGLRSLYVLEGENLPDWAGGMASFDRDHLLRHDYVVPGIESMVREIQIDCITFDDVLGHLPEDRVDLLQIDAEGADGFVLSLFPFDRVRPAIVHWESKNMTKLQQEQTLDRLFGYGYRVARSGEEDSLAVLNEVGLSV